MFASCLMNRLLCTLAVVSLLLAACGPATPTHTAPPTATTALVSAPTAAPTLAETPTTLPPVTETPTEPPTPEALTSFDQALELSPKLVWALAGRGAAHLQLKRYGEALKDFSKVIELEPNNHWCLYCRALAHYAEGQTDAAQTDFRAAIKIAKQKHERDPKEWRNMLRLALYYLTAGEVEEAERLYRKTLTNDAPAYRARVAAFELDDFLPLFPDRVQASAMQDWLQGRLQEAEQ